MLPDDASRCTHPLIGSQPSTPWRPHCAAYLAELVGTALLVFVGLSAVIFDFGRGSPVAVLLPDPFLRRLLTGLLFGGTGALIALSPLGRISGAHLDPVLSWGFWLAGSLGVRDAIWYTLAQFIGAVAGALPLPVVWGAFGASVRFAATTPGPGVPIWQAFGGEVVATGLLVGGILWFVGHPRLRAFTPALIPPLVALLVGTEAPLSDTSMNPARSLGPALVAHALGWLWLYFSAPALGALIAALITVRAGRTHVAKIAHHGTDPRDRFHGSGQHAPVLAVREARVRGGPAA